MSYTHKEILNNDMLLDQRDAMIDVMLDAKNKYCANLKFRCEDCEYFKAWDCEVVLLAEALMNAGYGFMGE